MAEPANAESIQTLRTLPGDDVRQIMWRYQDRYDLQMLVQSARSVARGPVARLVADGGRNTHDWTEEKAQLLKVFDESGLTASGMDPQHGGYIEGPKNLAFALAAFELSWVDAGSATCSMAGNLALAPIHERGTKEQVEHYMAAACPGPDKEPLRGAFALTEPLPYVGVDTGVLSGKLRVLEWEEGQEPILEVEKRGRFITNMEFAKFVTAAVDTGDERIKSSCMVIIEESDEGLFDPGTPTHKLVHQLSSTCDPVFRLKVPASRIVGGYSVKDGVIVPRFSHSEVIEAVFRRTRVTVGLMTAAKLVSAVEPIIRYHRGRFRGGSHADPGSPRHDLGIQMKEDALHRLVDVWAAGEAASSFGFEAARLFDQFDPLEKQKEAHFREQKVTGRKQFMALKKLEKEALEFLALERTSAVERDSARHEELKNHMLVQYTLTDSVANVLCPACKLWNTGHGATVMREAVSLMGGYGITEDCPGFLGHKWMDAQLEATYEGPESVQRRQLSVTMTAPLFLAQFRGWIEDLEQIDSERRGSGICALVAGMKIWLWTLEHLQKGKDESGGKLYHRQRQGVAFPLADALCWLLSARALILDVLELERKGPENPVVAEGLEGLSSFFTDLYHVQCARAAGEVGRIVAELVYGYTSHPAEACHHGKVDGLEPFVDLRMNIDGCLSGARTAKDRAAQALTQVMIPEALDYPL